MIELLVALLLLLTLALAPIWDYSRNLGYTPSGLVLLLAILIALFLLQ